MSSELRISPHRSMQRKGRRAQQEPRNGKRSSWFLAGITLRGVEGYLRHAAAMDAGRRQGALGADALDQSLLARHAAGNGSRPWHAAYVGQRTSLPDRIR